jgi:multidrug efflux pump subunit AcrA (membrane-fusion protein)
MKRRNIIIIAVIAVFVLLVAARIVQTVKAKKGVVSSAALPVEVITIAPQDYDETLPLSGTVMAENQAEVPAKVPGKIIKYLFEEGDWVDKGQTVVTIDRDEIGVEFKEASLEAPISGWLTKKYFDTGAHVAPNMPPNLPLFQIANYSRVKLMVSVPESDISKVRPGQRAAVAIDAWPDQTFSGTVKKVSPTVDYLSRTAKAEIVLANPGLNLRPGMYGRAVVKVKRHPKGLVIPTTAILQREAGTQVFVVVNGKAVVRTVTVDIDMGENSSIKSGLAFGEKLIVAGQNSASDGSEVNVIGGALK